MLCKREHSILAHPRDEEHSYEYYRLRYVEWEWGITIRNIAAKGWGLTELQQLICHALTETSMIINENIITG